MTGQGGRLALVLLAGLLPFHPSCTGAEPNGGGGGGPAPAAPTATAVPDTAEHAAARERMVARQIEARGVRDPRVLAAMRKVPRHAFVPEGARGSAYDDRPLPIGLGQTISQPYIVAHMTEEAKVEADDRVLEIGTGSGYQAAVLAEVAKDVYSIELLAELGRRARAALDAQGYGRIETRVGDGYQGWAEKAPFDAILVTAAAPEVPKALVDQLVPGGRLVIPVGPDGGHQVLLRLTKQADGSVERVELTDVRFVPLVPGGAK